MDQSAIINKEFGYGLPLLELLFVICATIFYINFEMQAQFRLVAPFVFIAYISYYIHVEPQLKCFAINLLILISLLVVLFLMLTDSTSIGNVSNRFLKVIYAKFSQWILVFFPILLFHRVYTIASKKQILLILGVGLLNAIILVQTALKIIEINPTLLHSMNADRLKDANVNLQGFSFVYAFTFLSLTCYTCFKYTKNKWIKYLFFSLLLYSIYFMFASQFALCLVTTFISFIYLEYSISSRNNQKKILSIIGLSILILSLPYLLEFLINISNMEVLNVRLQEIHNVLIGNSINSEKSDLNTRLNLYWKSIMAFLDSPIWGNRTLNFDPHATFLSILADLGILGGIIIYKLFSKSFDFMKTYLDAMFDFYKPLICQIIIMGFTNPIHSSPSNYIMLWFICPLLMKLFIDNEKVCHAKE